MKDGATDSLNCQEFRALQARFSTGVRLRELGSIATVLATLIGAPPPQREARRHYVLLINWFRAYWPRVAPLLPLVTLRDKNDVTIDGRREAVERNLKRWTNLE